MWHASAATIAGSGLGWEALRALAFAALEGVGNPKLGQWEEQGQRAHHVRRRLSEREQKPIGEAVDCRGTDEGLRRFARACKWMPPPVADFAEQELTPA